jgi:sugar lactone lactonase YvrE
VTQSDRGWTEPEEFGPTDLVWAESPRWRNDELWVSDTQSSRLVVVRGEASRIHQLETPVNGTWFLSSGELVAARMRASRVDRFDGESWTLHAALDDLVSGHLGDLIALADGTVYVDDQNRPGRVLRIDAGGRPSIAAEDLVFPNGLAVVDDGSTLVVAETYAARLTAFTLGPGGQLTDRRLWLDLQRELGPEHRPDGIWSCRDGTVWIATTTGGAVARAEGGRVVEQVAVDGFTIACCMDDDETALYVTVARSTEPGVAVLDAVAEHRTNARVLRFRRAESDHEEPTGGRSDV